MTTLRHYCWELLGRLAEFENWSNGRVGQVFPSNEELGPNGRSGQKVAAVQGVRFWILCNGLMEVSMNLGGRQLCWTH